MDLMQSKALPVPDFWRGTVDDVSDALKMVRRGAVREIGLTAGKRPIHVVTYGQQTIKRPRTANYSSALGAHKPAAYVCKKDRPPTLLLVGGVHGSELEGIVGLNNLLSILESGCDYRGKPWPKLKQLLEGMQVLIVPLLNVDGRARVKAKSYVGETLLTYQYYAQGTRSDGEPYTWPAVKEFQPITDVGFLGGYFNDQGINPMHDNFFVAPSSEVATLFRLVDETAPDLIIQFHGGGIAPFHFTRTAHVPRSHVKFVHQLAVACHDALKPIHFEPRYAEVASRETLDSFNLASALHHICGGISFVFESSPGLEKDGKACYEWDEILDAHLKMLVVVAETMLQSEEFRTIVIDPFT